MSEAVHHQQVMWPPQRRFEEVERKIQVSLDAAEQAGVPKEQFRETWIEAAKLVLTTARVPARWKGRPRWKSRDDNDDPSDPTFWDGDAQPSGLIGKVLGLFGSFVLSLQPAFSATQRAIAHVLGLGHQPGKPRVEAPKERPDPTGTRQVRQFMRQLEAVGLLERLWRYQDDEHEPGESRSTVYILKLPASAIELLEGRRKRRARRLPLQARRQASPTPAPASTPVPLSNDAPKERWRPSQGRQSASPAAAGDASPAAESGVDPSSSWWLPLAREERSRRYPDAPPAKVNVRAPKLGAIEATLTGAAQTCLRDLRKWGAVPDDMPDVNAVRRELAVATMRTWLDEPHDEEHPLAFFAGDVGRLAGPAGAAWKCAWHAVPNRKQLPPESLPAGIVKAPDDEEEAEIAPPPADWRTTIETGAAGILQQQAASFQRARRQTSAVVPREERAATNARDASVQVPELGGDRADEPEDPWPP